MTDIVPIPALRPSSEFPTNADRNAGVFNFKAFNWADTSRDMASDMTAIADAARTNAIATTEIANDAKSVTGQNKTAAQQAQEAAELAAANAAGSAAFYGRWSELTGPLNMPANVTHAGKDWRLVRNLANVATAQPGVSDAWEDSTPARVLSEWAHFTSSSTFTCPYNGVVRAYALGKGANGTSTYGGGGGSMGYGDIPVIAGDLLQINITGGVCTISKNGVQMLRGNASTGQSGATATANHVAVSNGGSYPGGNGGAQGGGGGAGSPLGQGGGGVGYPGAQGGGGGGLAGNATGRGGGGVGYPGEQGGGGSGGPAIGHLGGVGRTPWTAYRDPLLTFANGPGASDVSSTPTVASNGGGAAGYGGTGGFGGGGSGGMTNVSGGDGGFGGGGGYTSAGAGYRGGNGGFGGGGGGAPSTATQGLGGAAWAGLFY